MTIQRVYLTYSQEQIKDPIIYKVGKEFDVVTNIRGASVSDHIGIVALELEGDEDEVERAIRWIADAGIKVEPIQKNVIE